MTCTVSFSISPTQTVRELKWHKKRNSFVTFIPSPFWDGQIPFPVIPCLIFCFPLNSHHVNYAPNHNWQGKVSILLSITLLSIRVITVVIVSVWAQQSTTSRWLQTVSDPDQDVLDLPPLNNLKTLSCASYIKETWGAGGYC